MEQYDDTGYMALCLPTGEWDNLVGCKMIFCNQLIVDKETVDVSEIINMYNVSTHASKLKLNCTNPLDDFDFGQGIRRVFATCGKK